MDYQPWERGCEPPHPQFRADPSGAWVTAWAWHPLPNVEQFSRTEPLSRGVCADRRGRGQDSTGELRGGAGEGAVRLVAHVGQLPFPLFSPWNSSARLLLWSPWFCRRGTKERGLAPVNDKLLMRAQQTPGVPLRHSDAPQTPLGLLLRRKAPRHPKSAPPV